MCLILLAYAANPTHRLIVLANRDEHYSRPTAPLDFWQDHPQVLAGRDLEHHGTWMGVTRTGRLAAITNYRAPHLLKKDAPSRGHLVSGFLLSDEPPAQYLRRVLAKADAYNGFNLIVGDSTDLFYYSNMEGTIRKLEPGIYGLSNHLLDTPWPKVLHARQALAALVNGPPNVPGGFFEGAAEPHDRSGRRPAGYGCGCSLGAHAQPGFHQQPDLRDAIFHPIAH
jgi:uncharacterized protein with NRDE domain